MTTNRIKDFRARKGMTQKQLAQAVGTSQQQIQRIEAGLQSARFDVAVSICTALGEEMAKVFPSAALSLQRSKGNKRRGAAKTDENEIDRGLEEAGLDMDPTRWSIQIRLRGGAEDSLPISSTDRRRIWMAIQEDNPDSFIVFNSGSRKYAINPNHLLTCHFLFDPPSTHTGEEEESSYSVEFFLSDRTEPLEFEVEPDSHDVSDDSAPDGSQQIQDLFIYAEMSLDNRLKFEDVDGEMVFVRSADISMFSAPLVTVSPTLMRDDLESEDD